MTGIATVSKQKALAVFGSVWLAEDFGCTLREHLGRRRPSLHFGEVFPDLETARAARPGYAEVPLAEAISLPNATPVPLPRRQGSSAAIPREVFVVEFGNLLQEGLRVARHAVGEVEFDLPPAHLMGKVDFVAAAVIAGPSGRYRVLVEYDGSLTAGIPENPQVLSGGGSYTGNGQAMAFFREEDAVREADRFAEGLVRAADWRSRARAA